MTEMGSNGMMHPSCPGCFIVGREARLGAIVTSFDGPLDV